MRSHGRAQISTADGQLQFAKQHGCAAKALYVRHPYDERTVYPAKERSREICFHVFHTCRHDQRSIACDYFHIASQRLYIPDILKGKDMVTTVAVHIKETSAGLHRLLLRFGLYPGLIPGLRGSNR